MITRGGSTTNIQHTFTFHKHLYLSLSSFLGTPFAMDFGSRLLPTQVDAVSGHAAISACEAGTTPCRTGYVGYVMSGFDHPSYCTTPQNTTNIPQTYQAMFWDEYIPIIIALTADIFDHSGCGL